MNLLIITQKVDQHDNVLGFFHRWLVEFARHAEVLHVICLEAGSFSLPENTTVHSLGKPQGGWPRSPLRAARSRARALARFCRFLWRLRNSYDAVFVHMNPEYVVWAGLWWRLTGKRIGLWYVHRNVTAKLFIAEKLAHVIFSSSPESFRLPSKKTHFLGHGIDLARFEFAAEEPGGENVRGMHAGRITPIKNLDTLIDALAILKNEMNFPVTLSFIGAPATESDRTHLEELKRLADIRQLAGAVSFLGPVPHERIAPQYREAHFTVNLCPTGGMDKAVLESMAVGTPVFFSNKAFESVCGEYAPLFMFAERDARDLAEKIRHFYGEVSPKERHSLRREISRRVREEMDVSGFMQRLVSVLNPTQMFL